MDDNSTSDEHLVRAWRTGRREVAAATLFHRYALRLFGLFRKLRFCEDACHDLVQETFRQAFHSLDTFRFESSFQTWLFEIARNTARKKIRHQQALKRQATEVPIDEIDCDRENGDVPDALVDGNGDDDPLGRVLAREGCHYLEAAVADLAPEDRRMVRFRLAQELTDGEIAVVLKIPVGTVKSRWSRIRATLRRKLATQYSNLPF